MANRTSQANETNIIPSQKATHANSQLFLDALEMGVSGTIVVMICRRWDVNARTGRYISTDFIVSDGKGNIMHCTSKASVSHNFVDKLKDGMIYSIKDFTVIANKDEYRVLKDSAWMIEFDGSTTVRKAAFKPDGFVRHPFELVAFENLQPTDNKFLIDVIGYVTNVGRTSYQKTGSRNLDFYLANQSGQSIRVTLWGRLGEVLVEMKTKQTGLCAVILTSVNARLYNNKLYLSSTSSSLLLDDDDIPALKRFKGGASGVNQRKDIVPVDHSVPKPGTLENVLMWARNRQNDSSTFICKVRIDNVITRKGWNYPSCGGGTCKKGLTRQDGRFWCDGCNTTSDYPLIRYRLELGVSDETERTIVVLFDETATELVKHPASSLFGTEAEDSENHAVLPRAITDIVGTTHNLEIKTHTYYEHGNYESFTCSAIITDQSADECGNSSTVEQIAASETTSDEHNKNGDDVEQSDTEIEEVKADQHSASKKRKLKKLSVDVDQSVAEINEEKAGQDAASKKHMLKKSTDDLSVPTPLKSTEQKSKKRDDIADSDTEIEEGMKKKRFVVEDSDTDDEKQIKVKVGGSEKKKLKKKLVVASSDEE